MIFETAGCVYLEGRKILKNNIYVSGKRNNISHVVQLRIDRVSAWTGCVQVSFGSWAALQEKSVSLCVSLALNEVVLVHN
jgi:hypothetical protein